MLFNSESSVSNTSTTSTTSVSNLKTWDGQDYSAAIFLKNINTFSKAMRWKSALYDGYYTSYNKIITHSAYLIPVIKENMANPPTRVQAVDAPMTPSRPSPTQAYELTEEDKKTFTVSAQLFFEKLATIESAILAAITDKSRAAELKSLSRGNAIDLIAAIRNVWRNMPMADIVYVTDLLNDMANVGLDLTEYPSSEAACSPPGRWTSTSSYSACLPDTSSRTLTSPSSTSRHAARSTKVCAK